MNDVYLDIRKNGFNNSNLKQIEHYAKEIESGRTTFARFNNEEQRGFNKGGRTHVEASVIVSGSLRAGEEFKGRKLEQWEENDRQEEDVKAYPKERGIWVNNTDKKIK